MNPLIILSAVFATACAAPQWPLAAGHLAAAPYGLAGVGLAAGAVAAPALAAAAPVAVAAAAPVAVAPAAISVPAPYTTAHVAGAPTESVHQPPAVINKEVHYGQRTYVAGYDTTVLKPQIPDLRIAVPTALKGSVSVNPAIVTVQKEDFVVNEPYAVERPYNVPYDVVKNVVRTVEVPTPVHVDRPYNVPVPTPVQGETIIKKVIGAPIVHHSHERRIAPAVHTTSYAHAGHAIAAPLAGALPVAAPVAIAH